jgi:hypothetical protein
MAKFTKADLQAASNKFKMLSYYPTDPGAQAAVMELLAAMCPHREALDWLVDAMVNRVGKWPGPAELRGVLCWHCRPADGIEAPCSLAGFTAADGERLHMQRLELGEPGVRPKLVSADQNCQALVLSIADRRRYM